MPLDQIPGPRGGLVFHDGDGFIYKRQKEVKGVTYFICGYRKCPSRGTLQPKSDTIKVTKKHDHRPDPLIPQALLLRSRILQRCREEKEPCKKIFYEEVSKMSHLAKHEFIRGMGSAMQRARFAACPAVPAALMGFRALMKKGEQFAKYTTTLKDEPFLLDVVVSAEGDQAAIFLPASMKQLMKEAEEFHADASFKFVPDRPPCELLTVISAIFREHAFPVVYILMSKQTKSLYMKVFYRLLKEVPEWSPATFLADYEAPLLYALQEVFRISGSTSVHGCWFQFTQALWRKKRAMKLMLNSNTIALKGAQMAMVLPLLPHALIFEGLSEVITFLTNNLEGELLERMLEFMEYVDEWIKWVGPETISVDDVENKSIFSMQSFHRSMLNHLRSQQHFNYPEFWHFMYALQRVESEKALMLHVLEQQGFESGRAKRREEILQERALEVNKKKFVTGEITLREFLQNLSIRVFKPFLFNVGIQSQQNDEAPLPPDDEEKDVIVSSDEDNYGSSGKGYILLADGTPMEFDDEYEDEEIEDDEVEDYEMETSLAEQRKPAAKESPDGTPDVIFIPEVKIEDSSEDDGVADYVLTSEGLLEHDSAHDSDIETIADSSDGDITYVVVLDEMI
ncbi:uncharacterized protein [Anabrus simplex]|uniref:uncharacterized protein n=1 Tax=Anabrus simplex TaxID=316456 RepID=UPI0035A27DC5